MKTILRTVSIFAALIMSVNAYSQNQWYVTAGYLNSDNKASASSGGITVTTNDRGFYAGAGLEAPVYGIDNFYLDGALLYSYLGDKDGDMTENMHMLNIPLRAKYKIYLSETFGIFGYGGPVASFGLAANNKSGNLSYSLYGSDGILNRVDVKLGIGAGIELSQKIVFKIGYDWGLFNMSSVNGVKMHLNILNIGVSYNL